MAQVGAAVGAVHFGAHAQPQRSVLLSFNGIRRNGGKVARPARAGIEFGARVKQGLAATDAQVGAVGLVAFVSAGEGALCAFLAGDLVGQGLGIFFGQQGFELQLISMEAAQCGGKPASAASWGWSSKGDCSTRSSWSKAV